MKGNGGYEEIKKYKKYLRSEENKLKCKYYMLDCQRLAETANLYKDRCQLLYDELSNSVNKYEFSSGGEVLHRGYYCPSPIIDIVVGNGKRGKNIKALNAKSKPTYRYGFDSQNNLILVDILHLNEKEIIISNGNIETGICFSNDFGITALSESHYENQIVSYVYCSYSSFANCVGDYRKEVYQYSSEGLEVFDMFYFFNNKHAPILQHEQYHFQHDDNGYISKYTVTEYDGENIKDSMLQGHEFHPIIKRKV